MSGLIEIIHWLDTLFDRLGVRRSYGGAIAYNYFGPPRLTQDVDVLVLVPDSKIPTLLDALAAAGTGEKKLRGLRRLRRTVKATCAASASRRGG